MKKRTRLLACLLNFYSMSAVASYECVLKLAQNNDLNTVIGEKTLIAAPGTMNSGNLGTLFVEFENNRKKISLDINAVMNGSVGKENATFVMIRRTTKRFSIKSSTVSDVLTLKGSDQVEGWFDTYKLDISCQVAASYPQ